ncbi:MAG TPA: response regulator, partial [Chloroflexota bacterium]|nr:response regulator [Chloroflexota bacterium]
MTHAPAVRAPATRTRRALLAKFRHDLRTPLSALLGYDELLREEQQERDPSAHATELERIHGAGLGLLDGVNGLLAHERIESGALDGDLADFAGELRRALLQPATALCAELELLLDAPGDAHWRAGVQKLQRANESFLSQLDAMLAYVRTPDAAERLEPRIALVQDAVESIPELEQAGEAARARPGGVVLVVDDSPANRDLLAQNLARQGHTVLTAANGRAALELLAACKVDIILLDILMPEMNGYEVLLALKDDKTLREVPAIMISALDELDSIVRCIQMGAEDYLPKPFNPTLLQARIDASLEKKRFRDWQRELFHKFTTKEVADELFAHGFALGGRLVEATVMFCDIRSFTTIAESLPPDETIALLNGYFAYMMSAIETEGGIVNQIIGDGLMAIFGAPLPRDDHRERAVRA